MQTHTNTHKYIPHEYVVGNQHTLVFQPLTGLQPRLLIETMRRDENQWDHTGETQKIRKRKQESENGREKGEERVHSDHDPAVSCWKMKGGRPTRRFLIISGHIGATTEGGIHPIDMGMHTHIYMQTYIQTCTHTKSAIQPAELAPAFSMLVLKMSASLRVLLPELFICLFQSQQMRFDLRGGRKT